MGPDHCTRILESVPTPLTFANSFTQWSLDPIAVALVVVAAAAYVIAASRVTWPILRTVAFMAGLAVFLYCSCSFLAVYDGVLFWTRAVQNILLMMGIPLLLAMGAPLRLMMTVAGPKTAERLRRLGHSFPARAATMPLVVTVLLLAPLPILYLSGLYESTLRHGGIDFAVRLTLLVCGFIYYWTRLGIDPTPRDTEHVTSFAISFAETLVDGVLGVIIWLGPLIANGYYLGLHRSWDPSMRQDQTMGAVALWFGGDAIGIPYLVVLFVQWIRDEGRKARRIDAELDRQDAQRKRAIALSESRSDEPPADGMQSGLWWENNPELSRRYGTRRRDE